MSSRFEAQPFTPHPFHWGIRDLDKKAWIKDNWGLVMLWHEMKAKQIAEDIQQKFLEATALCTGDIFWDCRNSAIEYRRKELKT